MRTREELVRRAERQRARRIGARRCGNCRRPAELMLEWAGQTIPVCRACKARLDAPGRPLCSCALEEAGFLGSRTAAPIPPPLAEDREVDGPRSASGPLQGLRKRMKGQ